MNSKLILIAAAVVLVVGFGKFRWSLYGEPSLSPKSQPKAEAASASTTPSITAVNGASGPKRGGVEIVQDALRAVKADALDRSKLKITELRSGHGVPVRRGQRASIRFTLKALSDGKVWDGTSLRGDRPSQVVLGSKPMIRGVDLAIEGMQLGQMRKVEIPGELLITNQGSRIPGLSDSSAAELEVELVGASQ